jgi:hypothetical protein
MYRRGAPAFVVRAISDCFCHAATVHRAAADASLWSRHRAEILGSAARTARTLHQRSGFETSPTIILVGCVGPQSAIVVLASIANLAFALRTYRSFQLLQSAYGLGAPQSSSIRPWMTLRYVAIRYRVPETDLTTSLGLPSDTEADTTLKSRPQRHFADPIRPTPATGHRQHRAV